MVQSRFRHPIYVWDLFAEVPLYYIHVYIYSRVPDRRHYNQSHFLLVTGSTHTVLILVDWLTQVFLHMMVNVQSLLLTQEWVFFK